MVFGENFAEDPVTQGPKDSIKILLVLVRSILLQRK